MKAGVGVTLAAEENWTDILAMAVKVSPDLS